MVTHIPKSVVICEEAIQAIPCQVAEVIGLPLLECTRLFIFIYVRLNSIRGLELKLASVDTTLMSYH